MPIMYMSSELSDTVGEGPCWEASLPEETSMASSLICCLRAVVAAELAMPSCVATGSRLLYGCSSSLSESTILRRLCGVDAATAFSG